MGLNKRTDLLQQGTLELLVLRLLRSGALNGWDIMQRIRVVSDEVLSITPGALYPALHRLEERGLLAADWGVTGKGRRARYYRPTRAGRAHLDAEAARLTDYVDALTTVLAARTTQR